MRMPTRIHRVKRGQSYPSKYTSTYVTKYQAINSDRYRAIASLGKHRTLFIGLTNRLTAKRHAATVWE